VKKIKLWVKGFFGFSRSETNAFIILIPLMFGLIFSEPAYRYWFVRQPIDYSKERNSLDSLLATMEWKNDSVVTEQIAKREELFVFDPNLSSKDDLMRLGFSQSLANRIVNYRLKGGKFQTKKDLMKIYGMDSSLFKSLLSYIKLPESVTHEKSIQKKEVSIREKPTLTQFDLNTADTSQLISIYGIGPKLSLRIIAFREKLGGFILTSQLSEVYGLDTVAIKQLLLRSFIKDDFKPRQVNVNKATEKELGAHPYIKYKLARAIVAYRMQHGIFNSVEDLKKITILDESNWTKLKPYISLN
jgi:competence ComEA-like helix-hairpin-helix protein